MIENVQLSVKKKKNVIPILTDAIKATFSGQGQVGMPYRER